MPGFCGIVSLTASSGISPLSAWLGIAAFGFQIYFDFSGYSDMAIGLGKMFGFIFPENFDYPYISKSITEFLAAVAYFPLANGSGICLYPLGGNRRHPVRILLLCGCLPGCGTGQMLILYCGAFITGPFAY